MGGVRVGTGGLRKERGREPNERKPPTRKRRLTVSDTPTMGESWAHHSKQRSSHLR